MFKKVIVNTGSQIIGKAITASASLVITLLISRSLGASGYGDFTKTIVFVGYFYTLCDFGLNQTFIKLEDKGHQNLFRPLVGLRLIMALIFSVVAIVIAFVLPFNPQTHIGFSPGVKVAISLASLTIITQTLLTTANAFFQKHLRYELSTIAVIIGTIITLITVLVAFITGPSIYKYIFAYVLGGIVFSAFAFYFVAKKLKQKILPDLNFETSKKLFLSSWPIGLALVFNLVYFRIDVLILSAHRSSAEVGVYGLAYQFFEASLAIPIFFANSLYPLLSTLYLKNLYEYQKQVKKWLLILVGFSLVLSLCLIVISYFIPLVFGKSFSGSPISLRILASGIPFFFISAILWHLLIIHDKQKFLSFIYAAGAIFNFLANLIFIPKFGYIAASVITVVSEFLITVLLACTLKLTQNKT